MSGRRKDHNGRVLKTGESQRKDLTYQFRYKDVNGKRQTIYANDLKTLREKEKVVQKTLDAEVDYPAGKITVIELLERYIRLKQGVRYNTKVGYNFVLNLVKQEDFGYRYVRDIKMSDVQLWVIKLHEDGRGYSTITSVRGVLKPAFQMACNEDVIRKNPFAFKLTDYVPNDSKSEKIGHIPSITMSLSCFWEPECASVNSVGLQRAIWILNSGGSVWITSLSATETADITSRKQKRKLGVVLSR